jgi:HlyD family secretion protein
MGLDKNTLETLRINREAPKPHNSHAGLWLAVFIMALLALGLGWKYLIPSAVAVRTATVREPASAGRQTILNASGYVTARRQATVSSKVTGKVTEVLFEEGQQVQQGKILAKLDTSNVTANLKLAEAQLLVARVSLDETKVLLEQSQREQRRISELAVNRISSQSDLDRSQSEVNSLKARLERQQQEIAVAQSQVDLWLQQLDDTIIRAPFPGIIISKNAQPGEMISPMSAGGSFTRTGIGTIVDMESIEVEVDVNESYIGRVEPGQRVQATLDAYPDWQMPAKVIAIIPTADRQKATVKVRIGFEKLDPKILPDMGVKVAFQSAADSPIKKPGLLIPKAALRQENGHDFVWIVQQGCARRRPVTVSARRNDELIISDGLTVGEKVVLEGPAELKEGARVFEEKR